jgi:hypothetical protein
MRPAHLVFAVIALCLAACAPEAPLPTVIPSSTPITPTATAEPTITPTASPTAVPVTPTQSILARDPAQQGLLRFVHAAPGLGTVDIVIEGQNFAGFIEYGQYTQPSSIAAGTFTLHVLRSGTTDLASAAAVYTLTIRPGESQILVLNDPGSGPTVAALLENLSPIEGDASRITLFNALSSQPANLNSGTLRLINDTAYGQASPPAIVSAGTLDLNVRSGGEIVATNRYNMRPRQNVTVIALPDSAQRATLLFATSPIPGVAVVNAISMVDAITVDVLLNDQPIGVELGYGYITPNQTVTAQDYTLSIYAHGVDRNTVAPLYSTSFTLQPNSTVNLIALGTAENVRFVARRLDTQLIPFGKARLNFINALPDVPRAQVQSSVSVAQVIPYAQQPEAVLADAGSLPLTWYRVEGGREVGDPLEIQPTFSAQAGEDVLYILTGRSNQPPITIVTQVGSAERPLSAEELVATTQPTLAPSVYALNGAAGTNLQFLVDDVPLGSPLASFQSNSGNLITAGEHVFTIVRPDTGELLGRLLTTTEENREYVIVAAGRVETGYSLWLFAHDGSPLDSTAPSLRLINLSEPSTTMGLAVGTSGPGSIAFPDLAAPPDPATGEIPFRVSLPGGVTAVINGVTSFGASPKVNPRTGAGVRDIFVIDNQVSSASNIRPGFTLEPGRHYDVIAIQSPFSQQVDAYIVPYLPPQ